MGWRDDAIGGVPAASPKKTRVRDGPRIKPAPARLPPPPVRPPTGVAAGCDGWGSDDEFAYEQAMGTRVAAGPVVLGRTGGACSHPAQYDGRPSPPKKQLKIPAPTLSPRYALGSQRAAASLTVRQQSHRLNSVWDSCTDRNPLTMHCGAAQAGEPLALPAACNRV